MACNKEKFKEEFIKALNDKYYDNEIFIKMDMDSHLIYSKALAEIEDEFNKLWQEHMED